MRKLSAVLAGLAIVVTLSAPAGADTIQQRHHRFSGRSDSPGEGRSRGDNTQHDDPSILF
ncbi:MAG: hypothetical protein LC792_29505 [Actinobacteria bacterium]|nr:hypothetical protein [Actinomycetota bacterium]